MSVSGPCFIRISSKREFRHNARQIFVVVVVVVVVVCKVDMLDIYETLSSPNNH